MFCIAQFARERSTVLQVQIDAGAVRIARASTANVLHCFASMDSTRARELPQLRRFWDLARANWARTVHALDSTRARTASASATQGTSRANSLTCTVNLNHVGREFDLQDEPAGILV